MVEIVPTRSIPMPTYPWQELADLRFGDRRAASADHDEPIYRIRRYRGWIEGSRRFSANVRPMRESDLNCRLQKTRRPAVLPKEAAPSPQCTIIQAIEDNHLAGWHEKSA